MNDHKIIERKTVLDIFIHDGAITPIDGTTLEVLEKISDSHTAETIQHIINEANEKTKQALRDYKNAMYSLV